MSKISVLQRINSALTPDETSVDFSELDKKIAEVKQGLKEKITVKTLDDVTVQLDKFKKKIDFEPLIQSIQKIENDVTNKISHFSETVNQRVALLEEQIAKDEIGDTVESNRQETNFEINSLRGTLTHIRSEQASALSETKNAIGKLQNYFNGKVSQILSDLRSLGVKDETDIKKVQESIQTLESTLEIVRKDLLTRINNLPHGGNAQRQINVNSSVMSLKYTDINFKNGGGIVWSASNDETYNRVNITASIISAGSGGGGGSVTGITRTTSIITASTTAPATAGVDYVFFAAAGLNLTLPTAINNLDQYTVKNTGNSSVVVTTSSGETIDGSASALLPIQNQSLDFISNGSVWAVV